MNKKLPLFYYISKYILGPIFMFYYNPRIIGKENILKDGPIIIAGNHIHLYDQCLAIVATKRGIRYMAKKEYFDNPKTRWFFKNVGCIPVDRSKKDPNSKKLALEVLNDGGALGIFPEGTRNRTDKILLDFKYGCVSFAQKTNAYIIPFGISGEYKFRSKNLTIRFGKPFKVSDDLEKENNKLYKEVLSLIKED